MPVNDLRHWLIGLCVVAFMLMGVGCTKPIDSVREFNRIAIVYVAYDPTIYMFDPQRGVDTDIAFAEFTGSQQLRRFHERSLNSFLVELMMRTKRRSGISIVRPLALLDTSLMQDSDHLIRYEYLLDPYDPIDINDRVFMAGLAQRLDVDAVVSIQISFAVSIDDTGMWTDFKDRTGQVLSYRQQLKQSHDQSLLRTQVQFDVIDQYASHIYSEVRFMDVSGDQVSISDADLVFPGGISSRLLDAGLSQWLNDWERYLPDIN